VGVLFFFVKFPHRFVKGHDRASLGLLALLWQVTGKLNGRPGRYSRAARFFSRYCTRIARFLERIARFARIQSQNKLFSHVLRAFNHKISCFRTFCAHSITK
jgi:hypothetical protein